MSNPKRIKIKFLVKEPDAVNLSQFTPIFHKWIRERSVPGLLIDVADYAHVPNGPGIMLIGHEGDYNIDMANGQPGLVYDRKLAWEEEGTANDTLQRRLQSVFSHALQACHAIETDSTLGGALTFEIGEAEITFLDRLNISNQVEQFDAVRGDIEAAIATLYGQAPINIERVETDSRRPLAVRLMVADAPKLASLVANVEPVFAE